MNYMVAKTSLNILTINKGYLKEAELSNRVIKSQRL